jgi:hypothetical protein
VQRYLAYTAGFVLFWLLSAVALVIAVDPYGLSPLPSSVTGFNAAKLGRYGNDRLIKVHDVNRLQPRTVIFGSSRVKQGLDPSAFAQSSFAPIYNAGVDNGNLAESARLLKHYAQTVDSLKYAFVELFAINNMAPPPMTAVPAITPISLLRDQLKIYSLSGIKASLATIAANVSRLGLGGYTRLDGFYEVGFPDCHECMLQRFPQSVWNEIRFDFGMSEQTFTAVDDLIAIGEAHNIEVYFFLSPFHARTLHPFVLEANWETLTAIKRRLAASGRVHDFLRYNEFTEEAATPDLQYFPDDYHFSPQLGHKIMHALFEDRIGELPSNWGRLLTIQTIDHNLAEWTRERNNWIQNHAEVVEEMERQYLQWIVRNNDVARWLHYRIRPGVDICASADSAAIAILDDAQAVFAALELLPQDFELRTDETVELETVLHAAFPDRTPISSAACTQSAPAVNLRWRFKRRLLSPRKQGPYSLVATRLPLEVCANINVRLHGDVAVPRVPVAVNAWASFGVHETTVRLDWIATVRDWSGGCIIPVDGQDGVFFAIGEPSAQKTL